MSHAESHFDPAEVLKQLIEGNIRYVSRHSEEYHLLKQKQTPKVTVLTCGDSRVPQNLFDVDSPNEIFMVRNIGNQFRNSEGSIKYPLLHLHTPLLIVMGHTGCGAITAALSDYRGEDDAIQREVVGLVNSIRVADQSRDMSKINDPDMRNAVYAQANVDFQIRKILSEYNLKMEIESGKLFIVGMMFDIHGIYGKDEAHVYLTNINGITDEAKLRKHALLKQLLPGITDMKIKRI